MFGTKTPNTLRYLDLSLRSLDQINYLKEVVGKIDRCRNAVTKKINIADILNDGENHTSLKKLFNSEFDVGLQMLLRLVLEDYSNYSFTINKEICDEAKVEYLYRSVGGWKTFDTVLAFQDDHHEMRIINPLVKEHWDGLGPLVADTIITVYIKNQSQPKMRSQEQVALERYETIFETVQNMAVEVKANHSSRTNEQISKHKKVAPARKPVKKAARRVNDKKKFDFKKGLASTQGELQKTLRFVISKIDTFVHAGNAHLIMKHLKKYKGTAKMFVIRVDPVPVLLDADSIWGKEIRNGESVLYEFYGDAPPTDDFERELMEKTNKYTQMDKIAD